MFSDNFFQYLQSVIDIVRIAENCPITAIYIDDPITKVWSDLLNKFGCRDWTNCYYVD